jgi:hypothetical protein
MGGVLAFTAYGTVEINHSPKSSQQSKAANQNAAGFSGTQRIWTVINLSAFYRTEYVSLKTQKSLYLITKTLKKISFSINSNRR